MEQITELMKFAKECPNDSLANIANMALEVSDSVKQGMMTKEQGQEILQDLVRADAIEGLSDDVQLKGMLITGVMGLSSIL
jgi:polyhydroxyalkanoate synthesis regulator phasin